eukprot:IDg18421t1
MEDGRGLQADGEAGAVADLRGAAPRAAGGVERGVRIIPCGGLEVSVNGYRAY